MLNQASKALLEKTFIISGSGSIKAVFLLRGKLYDRVFDIHEQDAAHICMNIFQVMTENFKAVTRKLVFTYETIQVVVPIPPAATTKRMHLLRFIWNKVLAHSFTSLEAEDKPVEDLDNRWGL